MNTKWEKKVGNSTQWEEIKPFKTTNKTFFTSQADIEEAEKGGMEPRCFTHAEAMPGYDVPINKSVSWSLIIPQRRT
jgi:hypothetical protein